MAKQDEPLVEVIKREEYMCPRTRTMRKRNSGYFMVPVSEAVKGIESGDYKSRYHPCGVVPKEWQVEKPKAAAKPKVEKAAEKDESAKEASE